MEKFPLHKAFTFLEPDPVVLVTTAGENRPNIMMLSWTLSNNQGWKMEEYSNTELKEVHRTILSTLTKCEKRNRRL